MKKKEVELTREQLYAEVWSTPMVELAKKYGISDVGLGKVCKRNKIPKPPVGYWAKVNHGKKVKQPRLPKMENAEPVRFQLPIAKNIEIQDPDLAAETERLLAFEALAANRIVVSKRLGKLHPFTEAIKAGRKWDKARISFLLDASPPLLSRALRVTDALICALDERGFLENGIFGQHTDLGVREIYESVLKESTKQRMKETGATRGGPWDAYDHIPTGRLRLQIEPKNYYFGDGFRHNWADGKTQRVEDFLNELICSLIEKAAVKRDSEIRWERQEQAQIEREKKEREKAEQIEKKRKLRAELIREAEQWQRANLIRSYISAYEEKYGATDRTKWAFKEANRMDPLTDEGNPKDGLIRLGKDAKNLSQREILDRLRNIADGMEARE